jgi:hypothetical protein
MLNVVIGHIGESFIKRLEVVKPSVGVMQGGTADCRKFISSLIDRIDLEKHSAVGLVKMYSVGLVPFIS